MAKFGYFCILSKGVGIISSQFFGHLRSFKGWIQTEACVIPCYHGMSIKQDYEMHYMIVWLKRCVFNLDLNRESVSENIMQSFETSWNNAISRPVCYIFYEVANSYEFVRPHSNDFCMICLNPSDG